MADIVIRLGQNPTTFEPAEFNVRPGSTFDIEVHKSSTLDTIEVRSLPTGVSVINRVELNSNVTTLTLTVDRGAISGPLTIGATRKEGFPALTGEKTSSGWIEVMS